MFSLLVERRDFRRKRYWTQPWVQPQVHSLQHKIQLTIAEKLCTNICEALWALQNETISASNRWQNNENKWGKQNKPSADCKARQWQPKRSDMHSKRAIIHQNRVKSLLSFICCENAPSFSRGLLLKFLISPFPSSLLCHWAVPSLTLILAKSCLFPWTPNSRYSWLLILHEYLIREEWSEIEREARKQLKAESALNDVHWMRNQYI